MEIYRLLILGMDGAPNLRA